jgi:hypothetical protein
MSFANTQAIKRPFPHFASLPFSFFFYLLDSVSIPMSFFFLLLSTWGVCDIEHERCWLLRFRRVCGLKEMTLLSDIYPDNIVQAFR